MPCVVANPVLLRARRLGFHTGPCLCACLLCDMLGLHMVFCIHTPWQTMCCIGRCTDVLICVLASVLLYWCLCWLMYCCNDCVLAAVLLYCDVVWAAVLMSCLCVGLCTAVLVFVLAAVLPYCCCDGRYNDVLIVALAPILLYWFANWPLYCCTVLYWPLY